MSGHLKTTVMLKPFGDVDVSTIDLSTHGWPGATGIETCLFWEDQSEVVAHYSSWSEAVQAHAAWTNPSVLSAAIQWMREMDRLAVLVSAGSEQ